MSDWTYWLIGAGILIVAELFIGTFYLLMIAVGLLCGAGVAWLGASGPQQTLAAALVGIGATMILRRTRYARHGRGQAANDPSINLDIGQRVTVPQWQERRARDVPRRAVGRRAARRPGAGAGRLRDRRGPGQPPDRRAPPGLEQSQQEGCTWNCLSAWSRS